MISCVCGQPCTTDHASRGLCAKDLTNSSWFTGPAFLWEKELPKREVSLIEPAKEDPEVKHTDVHTAGTKEAVPVLDRLQRFSDWPAVVRAFAVLLRLASREKKEAKPLTYKNTSVEERLRA